MSDLKEFEMDKDEKEEILKSLGEAIQGEPTKKEENEGKKTYNLERRLKNLENKSNPPRPRPKQLVYTSPVRGDKTLFWIIIGSAVGFIGSLVVNNVINEELQRKKYSNSAPTEIVQPVKIQEKNKIYEDLKEQPSIYNNQKKQDPLKPHEKKNTSQVPQINRVYEDLNEEPSIHNNKKKK